jgi:acyl carrier protein
MPNVEQELRRFVIDNFPFGAVGEGLSNDDSFLDQGIIDSTGVLELVTFLEETYEIKVEDEELIPDNLDSINRLVKFIERKLPVSQ